MTSEDLKRLVGQRLRLTRGSETIVGILIGQDMMAVGAVGPLGAEHPWMLEEDDGRRTGFFGSDRSIRIEVL